MKKLTTRDLVLTALFAALSFVGTYINIRIPFPGGAGSAMIHFGNIFCLTGALVLGGVKGGLAGGIGMGLFDLVSGTYALYAPGTFVGKFLTGLLCGAIMHRGNKPFSAKRGFVAAACGILVNVFASPLNSMIVLMLTSDGMTQPVLFAALGDFLLSVLNAVIAVIVSVPLAKGIDVGLHKTQPAHQ
ncbi:ECF transporter S component [Zongyangia hominis]|uniref:ECF transporter S component n=1 Tax=Zongyangia hominis TaxID=2763677 RepID=A0A926EFT6_9FIRM|nr:ECF transporter S component [Zongyangia hominis]MBC8571374.1 ECF transporter S component [Zongyangia hominis]